MNGNPLLLKQERIKIHPDLLFLLICRYRLNDAKMDR